MSTAERLLRLAVEDGDCLIWTMSCANGHPSVRINGKVVLVRRAIWEDMHGPIEPGKILRCTCGSPKCINPEHTVKTTYQRLAKELGAIGVMSGPVRSAKIAATKRAGPTAKLTDADVVRIRTGNETGVALALELGVNEATISRVRLGKVRKDYRSPWGGLLA